MSKTVHKLQVTSDNLISEIRVKDDGSVVVKTKSGFTLPEESTLMKIKDNGNGYYVRTKSFSSVEPDHIFNLDYCEIEMLYFVFKALEESDEKRNKQQL